MTTLKSLLQEIEDRANKAAPGPWRRSGHEFDMTGDGDVVDEIICDGHYCASYWRVNDAEFVAKARQDIPKLLAVIEKLIEQRNSSANPTYGDFMDSALIKILEAKS